MLDQLKEIRELQEQAKAHRKKGDALRRIGRERAALEAYRAGLAALTEALEILGPPRKQIAATSLATAWRT